jgi:hypothetical protein
MAEACQRSKGRSQKPEGKTADRSGCPMRARERSARVGGGGEFSLWIQARGAGKPPNLLNNQALGRLHESPLRRPLRGSPGCCPSCPPSRSGRCPPHRSDRCGPNRPTSCSPGCLPDCSPRSFPRCSPRSSVHCCPSRFPRCSPRSSGRCSDDCPESRFPSRSWSCSVHCLPDCGYGYGSGHTFKHCT